MKFNINYTVEDVVEYSVEELEDMLGKPLSECTQWEILEAVQEYSEGTGCLETTCTVNSISIKSQ